MSSEVTNSEAVSKTLPVFQSRRLYKQIAQALQERIEAGVFAPGSYLPSERDLAQQMGVSRPSVREALIALEVMGLVEVRVGDGVLVCEPAAHAVLAPSAENNSPLEQLEARSLLEGEVAALAAINIQSTQLDVLDAILQQMSHALDDEARFLELDHHFHRGIVEGCANQTLVDLVEYLWKLRHQPEFRKFEEHYRGLREPALVLREHRAILAALRARDVSGARNTMQIHLNRIRRQFIK